VAGFRRIGEREVWRGHVIRVVEGTFEAPGGERFDREVVRHPGAVSVVAVEDGNAVLVRQYRAALDQVLLEIPAGKRDAEEEGPEATAHRELAEEVGLAAGHLELLAEFFNTPGFCDEHAFVYLATDLTEVPRQAHGVEEQHLTVERVPLADVPGRIAAGDLKDAKSIIGLLLARERLE
jgi:8-oxo-dGTP pyrophosphatase MutT (NUDIX family)